jgi:hypothetical protein
MGNRPSPDWATANPVDALEWIAWQAGRSLDPQWAEQMRAYCDEPVEVAAEQKPPLAENAPCGEGE